MSLTWAWIVILLVFNLGLAVGLTWRQSVLVRKDERIAELRRCMDRHPAGKGRLGA